MLSADVERSRRSQRGDVRRARRRALAAVQVRGRPAPCAARARHREPGSHPHVVGDRARAARGGRGRRRDRRQGPADRRVSLERARRAERQHHRFGRAHHARAERASSCRCRTSAASCRTGRGRCRCCALGCSSAAERDADAERVGERRSQVGGGGRGEKIRTYNFKENRLTDHRIGFTVYRLAEVLAGDLDDVVDALAADERARQLAGEP